GVPTAMTSKRAARRFVLIGPDGVGMEHPLHMVREGHCPNMQRLLVYLVYKEDAVRYGPAGRAFPVIDWTRTRAAPQGVVNIFINLKGREPTGIVEPGAE